MNDLTSQRVAELERERDEAVALLRAIMGRYTCCCPHGIGDPRFTTHSSPCANARNFLARLNHD